ncbi:MAG TPA: ribbon-helix-helix protein, CopG family [Candidatus Aminicenantes bacterium]|nr:ribbon-helix-helix protein, CopG family [Candidatus Aminicenantes bacterium]
MDSIKDKVITARLPLDMYKDLDAVAEQRNRKRGAIVREAIEMYLSTWADYQIAIDRLKNSADKVLSEKEFLNDLGWDI